MDDSVGTLNYECNYNLFMIHHVMPRNFKSRVDRTKILAWIKKLRQYNNNLEELNLRNDFVYFLWTCVRNGELRAPFTETPPYDHIQKLKHLLPTGERGEAAINTDWIGDLENADSDIPDIYRRSPDGGAFLSAQPIPKCGAFCYLAIVSKPSEENGEE